ncbi:MAG TPA: hypothetical protein VF637_07050 [Sphingomicrobium sp.]
MPLSQVHCDYPILQKWHAEVAIDHDVGTEVRALLMPALVEDHVPADNPVRFIDAFIDDLD